MKKNLHYLLLIVMALFIGLQSSAAIPNGYYSTAMGKADRELMLSLHQKIKGHYMIYYNKLWEKFKTTDCNGTTIIDRYSNSQFTYSTDQCGTYSDVGNCYNREHSVPNSWWGGNNGETDTMYTDLYHMYPVDGFVNSKRGNYPFGDCDRGTTWGTGKLGTCTHNGYSGTVFEVADEYKGDFARTYFYMVVRYMDRVGSWTKTEGSAVFTNSSYKHLTPWAISQLLEWHRNDPVSTLESNRNEAVYGIQHNRNPFIDHPELAEYLWGNQTGDAWTGGTTNTPTLSSPANGSTINVGTNTGSGVSKTVTVKGVYLTKAVTVSVYGAGFSVSPATLTAAAVNAGSSVTVTYNGTAANATGRLTISSTEVSSNVTLTATYNAGGQTGGTEVVETWEGCTGYDSYATTSIQGHAFKWKSSDVGIWSGDANCNGELSCRFGKTSASYIEMAEDLTDGASKVTFYAANWSSNETAPTLQLQYSTDGGSTWTAAATCKPNATWQQYIFNVNVTGRVRFKILQTAGARLNIDDIAITSNPVVPAEPSLAITSIPAITAEQDGESTVVSATVTSENNTENITLSVEGNFLLSLDKRSWSRTLTLDPSGEVFYVRLAATSAVGDFEGLVSATTGKASAYADVNGTVTAKPHLQGDVNGDGTISITDVTSLIDYLLNDGGSAVDPSAADVNGDHTVSITDVTALIDLLLSAPSSMSMMWDAVPTAGGILVEHLSDGEVLEIYDMDAELRATVSKPGDQTVKLPAGTYVVAGDICSRKVVVK